jgi:hypothetical protein
MPENILGKVVLFIEGDDEPDSNKNILPKQVVKETSSKQVRQIYIAYPVCVLAQNTARLNHLQQLSVEIFASQETLELLWRLRSEAMQKRAKQLEPEELSRWFKEAFNAIHTIFGGSRFANVNKCYTLITTSYNFFSLIPFPCCGILIPVYPRVLSEANRPMENC